MEGAVGKSVDGEDVAVFPGEPGFKAGEVVVLEKFFGGPGGKSQADGVGVMGRDLVTNHEGVLLQGVQGFHPRFSGMDIGAVGEVMVVIELHAGD
jgi:hypothetical protein